MVSTPASGGDAVTLEAILLREIPATQALEMHVAQLSPRSICLQAPVAKANVNIHGSAFAGSIYSLSAVAAWGLAYHGLHVAGMEAELVIAEGHVRYLRPVEAEIIAEVCFPEQDWDRFVARLLQNGKAVLVADVQVFGQARMVDDTPGLEKSSAADQSAMRATNRVTLVAIMSRL